MNYGQTAIGEVRVIANYLGINPWEFESPFVLAIFILYISIYGILYFGDSSLFKFHYCEIRVRISFCPYYFIYNIENINMYV